MDRTVFFWICFFVGPLATEAFDIEIEKPRQLFDIQNHCTQWTTKIVTDQKCPEYDESACEKKVKAQCPRTGRLLEPPCPLML